MTIEEAIEYLQAIHHNRMAGEGFDGKSLGQKALKLGIEALKRCAEARKKAYFTSRGLLPSETKE